jgi:dihydroorotate dehydrogenase
MYELTKSLLFRLEPERAHAIGLQFMRLLGDQRLDLPSLRVKTSFGELPNPIGLAAGFDKDAKHLSVLEKLGFGYIVAGTVTKPPWPGHPKPRIARNPKEKTMMNSMGFPNDGVEAFIRRIQHQELSIPLVGSISGQIIRDIIDCYEKLQPYVAAVELNLSSPNTAKLRDLREPDAFREIATEMAALKRKPTYLKIPPYIDEAQFAGILNLVKLWGKLGFEGVTACNAIPMSDERLAVGAGGFSGPPLLPGTIQTMRALRKTVPPSFEINAVGGISKAEDARRLLAEGATTLQIYTALIFEGPWLIREILKELSTNPQQQHSPTNRTNSVPSLYSTS